MLFLSTFSNIQKVYGKETTFDYSQLDHGIISVNYKAEDKTNLKLMISKGSNSYIYTLNNFGTFPLQMNNGEYIVSILENVKDNKYRVLEQELVELTLNDDTEVFLQSTQIVNWNYKMKAIKKAKELAKNKKTEAEKVEAIYQYIIENIEYDKNKAKKVTSDYLPSIDGVFTKQSGICYDYASLFAAMLRSVDIPTKLVMGYKSDLNEYHAWNQVYYRDTNKWITIDTTYDAGADKDVNMIKKAKNYTIKKIY